ncbi:MAG: hypothetical protein JW892_15985 [Anaerolineae bacterium]|nr:hypothetical protein [Anaerolineae bacterium]
MMESIKPVVDTALQAAKTGVEVVHTAWSLMEAASEKKPPSELLSQSAVRRIQGQDG